MPDTQGTHEKSAIGLHGAGYWYTCAQNQETNKDKETREPQLSIMHMHTATSSAIAIGLGLKSSLALGWLYNSASPTRLCSQATPAPQLTE